MIKVALETSCLSGKQAIRGVGFYTRRLLEAFRSLKSEGWRLELVELTRIKSNQLQKYSILHFPYFDPFFLTLPLIKFLPTIVTVHDLIPIKFPQHFPKGIKGWFKWQIQKRSLSGVQGIITDSECSKKDVSDIIGFPQEKIYRIYLAAGKQFQPMKGNNLKRVVQKYSLPDKFILYVGDLNWNKNIPGLVQAFAQLNSQNSKLGLVIVGQAFLEKELIERNKLIQLIKELKVESQIKFLGYVPEKDLNVLYNLAFCYCQPSYYEGFGLPVLEAMQAGCPVVCSNKSSLPEVVDKVAILVDPYKVEEIAGGIKKLKSNKRLYIQLRRAGIEQAKKFSWERVARETLKVYQEVVNSSS